MLFQRIGLLLSKPIGFLRGNKELAAILNAWGENPGIERNQDDVASYHDLIAEADDKRFVDHDTWNDLNLDSIFSMFDRCVSAIGSQFLFSTMHEYKEDEDELSKQFGRYSFVSKNKVFRDAALSQLFKLRHENALFLSSLIFGKVSKRPKYHYLIYILSLLSVLSITFIAFFPILLLPILGLFLINLSVNYFYGRKILGQFVDISYLGTMLNVGVALSRLNAEDLPQIEKLRTLRDFSISLSKKIGWLVFDRSRLSGITEIIVSYFSQFCLFDLAYYVYSIHYIKADQEKLQEIFRLVGEIDATISIASFLESSSSYCCPVFNHRNLINTHQIYHPLLDDPIANTFHLENKSVIVTGSNMAGKTTFIKTIGLNVLLGRTLSICFAEIADLPWNVVKTSIKRADDIHENKSYYYKEIESILEFTKMSCESSNYLFLIDEIFRGTNTIERIASATSVLKYLARHDLLLVTTHDIELQSLLATSFSMHHFRERIEGGEHGFDYLIHSGPTTSRNAIKLLEMKGYPRSVVSEANALAAEFTSAG